MDTCNTVSYIYLIQDGKDKNTNVYKIGRTTQNNADIRELKRIKSYSKGTEIQYIWKVRSDAVCRIEDDIKKQFILSYPLHRGFEWFQGNPKLMKKQIDTIIEHHENHEIDIRNTNTEESCLISHVASDEPVQSNHDEGDESVSDAAKPKTNKTSNSKSLQSRITHDVDSETKRFTCKRCGYSTEYKHVLIKHLEKANTCKAKLMDIDVTNLIHELTYKTKEYKCLCGKSFSHDSSLSRHRKSCKTKNDCLVNVIDPKDKLIQELQQKLHSFEQLKCWMRKLTT